MALNVETAALILSSEGWNGMSTFHLPRFHYGRETSGAIPAFESDQYKD